MYCIFVVSLHRFIKALHKRIKRIHLLRGVASLLVPIVFLLWLHFNRRFTLLLYS